MFDPLQIFIGLLGVTNEAVAGKGFTVTKAVAVRVALTQPAGDTASA
jgi:hypothetical protein